MLSTLLKQRSDCTVGKKSDKIINQLVSNYTDPRVNSYLYRARRN